MKVSLISTLLLATSAIARSPQHVNKKLPERLRREPATGLPPVGLDKRATKKTTHILPQNKNTTKYAVDGTKLPDVDFDIGESYAGLMPISSKKNASELYFWFFPSEDTQASDEILIWLNGGPGCSSLEGLLQENGPFLWQYGTYKPVKNNYRWNNLTNVVWVEQPAGTGFSKKGDTPSATNEEEVAAQFAGFWKNFVETFGLQNRKVYITGESYAGFYVPYIADHFLSQNNTALYDVHGIMIYDPSTSYDVVLQDSESLDEHNPCMYTRGTNTASPPYTWLRRARTTVLDGIVAKRHTAKSDRTHGIAVAFANHWQDVFNLNQTFVEDINNRSEKCGYTSFLDDNLVYPPKGLLPTPPNANYDMEGCELWNDIYNAASLVNPCFDIYQVLTTCPLLWDVLGFPGSFDYLPEGSQIYFNRTDVQKAINAPIEEWEECSSGVLETDTSQYSGLSTLPSVIEKTNNVIIGQGMLDYIIMYNGTLVMIQNMTFNGAQGFSKPPSQWKEFFVPYHSELSLGDIAGAGVQGSYHTERGLTMVTASLSGHMIPQYAPSAAYRMVEVLLGREKNLGVRSDFSTQKGNFGNSFNFVTANITK